MMQIIHNVNNNSIVSLLFANANKYTFQIRETTKSHSAEKYYMAYTVHNAHLCKQHLLIEALKEPETYDAVIRISSAYDFSQNKKYILKSKIESCVCVCVPAVAYECERIDLKLLSKNIKFHGNTWKATTSFK